MSKLPQTLATKLKAWNLFVCFGIKGYKYVALCIKIWCAKGAVEELESSPQSPDLNPIEHLREELEL